MTEHTDQASRARLETRAAAAGGMPAAEPAPDEAVALAALVPDGPAGEAIQQLD